MGDESRIPLSYAKPDLALRANWPAVVSLACVLIFPAAYGFAPHWFTSFRGPTEVEWVAYNAVWVISGLGAGIFGIIALLRSHRLRIGGNRIAWVGMVLGAVNLGGIPRFREYNTERASFWYGIGHSHVRCAGNMKSISQYMMLYAGENRGRLPDCLEDLILTQDASAESFVCPLSNDVPAAGATTQAVANNLSAGGHLSYVYLAKGMVWGSDPAVVLLYERPGNHAPHFDTVNFLFADGHIDGISLSDAKRMIKQLEAGINPPKP